MSFRPRVDKIVAVVYELLKVRTFDSRVDLRESVKDECIRLGIRDYGTPPSRVEDAIEHVEKVGRRHDIPKGEPPPPAPERPDYGEPLEVSREEARRLVGDITVGFRQMADEYVPKADRDPIAWAHRELKRQHDASRLKAARFAMQEITESIARCEALEAAIKDDSDKS